MLRRGRFPLFQEGDKTIRRTVEGAFLINLGGGGLLFLLGRGEWAWGFFLGFLASLGNFQLMAKAVTRIMGPEPVKRPTYLWKGFLFRLPFVGLFLFLAFTVLKADLFALVFGLLLGQVSVLSLLVVQGVKAQGEGSSPNGEGLLNGPTLSSFLRPPPGPRRRGRGGGA